MCRVPCIRGTISMTRPKTEPQTFHSEVQHPYNNATDITAFILLLKYGEILEFLA